MLKRPFALLSTVATAAVIAACSGGGGGSFTPSSNPSTSPQTGTVAFSITVPATPPATTTAGRRAPNFTAPSGSQSVSIALSSNNGSSTTGSPTVANLTSSTSVCTSNSSGLTCTVNVSAPAGSDTFKVTTYSQPNAQGATTGAGTVSVTASAGTTTTAPTTLSGTIAAVTVAINASVPLGQAATVPVVISAKDASGNTIIGSYSSPITLALTDASNHTKLSATSVADSTAAAAVTLSYDGGVMSNPASIAPSVTGLSGSALTSGTFTPSGLYPTVDGQQITWTRRAATAKAPATPGPLASPTSFTETFKANQTFNGISNVIAVTRTLPNYTFTNYYLWNVGATSSGLQNLGYEDSGTIPQISQTYTDKATCVAPYLTFYTTPQQNSSNTSAGVGPCTTVSTTTDSSGSSTTTTISNSDGSYAITWGQTSTGLPPFSGSEIVHSDGSATIDRNDPGYESYVLALGAPAPAATTIPAWYVTYPSAPLPSPAPTAPAQSAWTQSFHNWLIDASVPNGVMPSPLQTDSVSTKSATALPADCAVPSSILGASPKFNEIDEVYTYVDPLFNYFYGTYTIFELNGVGPVCFAENLTNAVQDVTDPTYSGGSVAKYLTTAYQYVTASTLSAASRSLHTSDARKAATFASQLLVASMIADREVMFAQHRLMQAHKAR